MLRRLIRPFQKRLRNKRLYILAGEAIRSARKLRDVETRVISLKTPHQRRGRVLVSYIIDAFLLPPDSPVLRTHTNYWQTRQIAQTWLDAGYDVDVIHWTNQRFTPTTRYDFFIDVRLNMERIAPRLNSDCLRIMFIETSHWLFHTTAQHQRLLDIQRRRHVTLPPSKLVERNQAIEYADCAIMLGNEVTRSTYCYAGKPIYPIANLVETYYPWPADKDFDRARTRFLWFGSAGFVHKGLDLALEAFAGMPEFHLTVCGPTNQETAFVNAYRRELYETPQITLAGWVDVTSPQFIELSNQCLGLIYPSCSEGCSGSSLTCMHAGLIPLLTPQCGIDLQPEYGVTLADAEIDTIRLAVRELAARPTEQLRTMAHAAWEFARAHHTRERFIEDHRAIVEHLIAERNSLIRQRSTS